MNQLTIASPLGPLRLVCDGEALIGVYFEDHRPAPRHLATDAPDDALLARAAAQLDEWFAGRRRRFELPLAPRGTAFQRSVWRALGEIEFGERRSYAELARAIGRPGAARAVGAANAKNPLSIVIPCHRVVGAGGKLSGYAGGVERKVWLLRHESRHHARREQRAALCRTQEGSADSVGGAKSG